jgi:hypothetical protein
MSWRSGSILFIEIWPLLQKHIPDQEERIEFTAKLLEMLVNEDMDSYDVEDLHPEVRTAMRKVGLRIAEPARYQRDNLADSVSKPQKSPWWKIW